MTVVTRFLQLGLALGYFTVVHGFTCASSASYEMKIDFDWTKASFGILPDDPRFGEIVAWTHGSADKMFSVGSAAPAYMKSLAESNDASQLLAELTAQRLTGKVGNSFTSAGLCTDVSPWTWRTCALIVSDHLRDTSLPGCSDMPGHCNLSCNRCKKNENAK